MKYLKLFILLFLFSNIIASCKMADLSNEEALNVENAAKAKGILQQAYQMHRASNWLTPQSYEVLFKDEFYGFIGGVASPFKEKEVQLRLQYIPNTFNGRMVFESGKMAKEVWGFSEGKTYTIDDDGKAMFEENKDIRFWVPTYQYFIEFPARILEANLFRLAGEAALDGVVHDLVFVSWNQVEAQKEFDQYIVWVNRETKLIGKIQYTIREANRWVEGYCLFKDIQAFSNILLPREMLVGSNLTKDYLHKMSIETLRLNIVEPDLLNVE